MRKAEIGIRLREARIRAGLSQATLAKRMATSQSAVARAESGLAQPSLDFIERFVAQTGPVRLGSLVIVPDSFGEGPDERPERVRRAVGDYEFNPWLRNPSRPERKSLEADGLSREYFERQKSSGASDDRA